MPHPLAGAVAALRRSSRSLTVQFTVALLFVAFLPMAGLGWAALQSVASASRETAAQAGISTADATATVLDAYIDTAIHNFKVFGDALASGPEAGDDLAPRLRHFIVTHPEFRQLTLVDATHRVLATSAIVAPPTRVVPRSAAGVVDGVTLTTVAEDEALLPTAQLLVPIVATGREMLIADLNLEYLWRMIHTLRLPSESHAMLVDERRHVMADSAPARYAAVARGQDLSDHPLLSSGASRVATHIDADGVEQLSIAAPLHGLPWTLLIEQATAAIDRPALLAQRQLAAAFAITLAGTLVALVFVSRTVTVPLQELTHATRTLADGDRVIPLRVPRQRELGDLVRAFHFLSGRLSELEQTVRRQERDTVLGQIGAGLLHDIAHPVRNIVNNARLLVRLPPDRTRECLQLIEREYETIDELIDNLKEFSQASSRLSQRVVPHDVIRDIASRLRHEAERRGVSLDIAASPALAPIASDPIALRRVLRNLTLNAIEAAQTSRGLVTLDAEDSADALRLTVRDTGPGLPSDLSTLFDPFRSTKRKGLGLGLATAKRLVEQMGGTLTATSEAGVGTCCTVTLRRFPETPQVTGLDARSDMPRALQPRDGTN